jgi:prepilin-type N-terminal cleavage/methylation domain-containing protein
MVMRERGFSVIELMTTLTLSALLALLAVPFTTSWVASARQLQARGDLVDAVGRARAIALRNGNAVAPGQPVARVSLINGLLTVRNVGAATTVWSTQFHPTVGLTLADGTPFNCMSFNSRGWPINDGTCTLVAPQLVLTATGQDNLNVDLL